MTNRMSYVDVAWPWGLVLIGLLAYWFGTGYFLRKLIIASQYIFMGGRMGLGAVLLMGHFKHELPRYVFQRQRWRARGDHNETLTLQLEIFVQAAANVSCLAIPAMLQAYNPRPELTWVEFLSYALWIGAYVMESTADAQKMIFAQRCQKQGLRKQTCQVGLWRFSRHPNYFAEWMVWNALVLGSLQSLIDLAPVENTIASATMAFGLSQTTYLMYWCLTEYTGCVPAEFFSLQKRPDYARYQKETNMFFPGPWTSIPDSAPQ
eukprot:CAMPEP_0119131268 /NCGR_PEP_ID=MMETSP1310-20130426/9881_1 /TAXON_ID=464262 /ORGANISM="Genus nov. species nov., Strain RCC2339" /LENGTH=262 /DNA_ID=CAMNT_0007121827 /DNA_START=305 /DNA_END=1093 /DNA_ORIENTATION=+